MQLKSIKLSGFKSFVDPTHFEMPGQLIGVVGPNGCGKSNIITAARRTAYNAIKKIKIPNNPFYRLDIGAGRMKKQLPELHRMGYAKGLEF